ncbi:signal peptide peptidase SppA [Agriterribacter sp.]|uniref:signal peptide peptidase SppA n=1 Tax=Agriterribacter sp. TaxID=2821509 RepID=UPI002B974E98|nr:signal peptide peptidase SppA [Agriterribacter sp.]HRO48225.1 signal peptide peptidase SppA [Agriterribacter sp.]HRQ19228.1 signal peptide peptidase SppA [Agriterribacter sp.]
MRSFFKFFLAALLALVVFTLIGFLILFAVAGSIASSEKTTIAAKSVLFIDLSRSFKDKKTDNTLARLSGDRDIYSTSLYDVVRLLQHAKSDSLVKGIYIKCNENANGFAASEELRNALLDFKESKKFVIAYGDMISQKAYFVASAADKIYCNPKGMIDWKGFASQLFFIKNALKKLEIEPQIFYDGKFKSATEPLREEKMTEANRLQTTVWLGDVYHRFLLAVADARSIDTATLHGYANAYMIQTANDAVKYKLLDGVKYDDEVKDEIRKRLDIKEDDKIEFVQIGSYAEATSIKKYTSDRIAVIYAEGDIVYGRGSEGQVGSDEFRNLISKARTDKNIKAIVLRVNSPGGSALASEIIWRETLLARKAGKPLVVSMGDVAASGGYYISCAADSIFAQPNTITGSIGVFGIVPNMQDFFKNKLGVTFDQVKTTPYADIGTTVRPLTEGEKQIIQAAIDTIYHDFKTRVADGRKKDMLLVDSIAQGRVWTGSRAMQIGLVDRLGGLNDAIACAAGMAKLKDYSLREYPEPVSFWDMLKSSYSKTVKAKAIREELSYSQYQLYEQLQRIRQRVGTAQTRLPYDIVVE